ncbi:MAG TPA: beta-galactosidase, partial [Spirochaetia bacterium]|nr:beta-galactosidase [Spirochaetia bacterium]
MEETMTVPRQEHPRPQFVRSDWLSLNGAWQFEIDPGNSGLERSLLSRALSGTIQVPFCPESKLSGIGNTDFLNAVWYRRAVTVPAAWKGKRVLLHFEAADYDTTVWVGQTQVGRHRGGFTPFTFEITNEAAPGKEVTLAVRCRDDHRLPKPRGKQSELHDRYSCLYDRTTGIWQTVWLEAVGASYLETPRITPDLGRSLIRVEQPVVRASGARLSVRAVLLDDQGEVARAEVAVGADFTPALDLGVPAGRRRLWQPSDPHLYRLLLSLTDASGAVVDQLESYAGLRSVTIDGNRILLNGRPFFQRLILDQGFYPDSLYTAPDDAALKRDIQLSLDAGFNGARLHQKVFEQRFLYHADRMGYLVWGELPDWGVDRERADASTVAQWLEALHRDYSHPCIVGWCPLNETGQPLKEGIEGLDDLTLALYEATKGSDRTRPVLDASGYSHRVALPDVFDCHDYEQDVAKFTSNHARTFQGAPFYNGPADRPWSLPYRGQPYLVSEFGGIWWNPKAAENEPSWGYGTRPRTVEEFYARFEGLCAALLANPGVCGYCYTQLTDVFQEQNGVYYFDRTPKFDLA